MTIFAVDMDATCDVYRAIGLTFVEEKHGEGPVHFAHENGGFVLEIYQRTQTQSDSLMLGFEVPDIAFVKGEIQKTAATLVKDVAIVQGSKRMIVSDPEGRQIYIEQCK